MPTKSLRLNNQRRDLIAGALTADYALSEPVYRTGSVQNRFQLWIRPRPAFSAEHKHAEAAIKARTPTRYDDLVIRRYRRCESHVFRTGARWPPFSSASNGWLSFTP